MDYTAEGTIRLHPPVPLAQLRKLIEQDAYQGGIHVAPHGLDERELANLAYRVRWMLAADADAGTDDQGRPQAIKHLQVRDPSVERIEVDRRLQTLSALIGTDHAFHGHLRYWAADAEGEICPRRDGESPIWEDTTPGTGDDNPQTYETPAASRLTGSIPAALPKAEEPTRQSGAGTAGPSHSRADRPECKWVAWWPSGAARRLMPSGPPRVGRPGAP
ncbi:hypothetical protein ABZ865_33890 [Streptomyces sp. NPDC047085]|uniref:hypothetical protein n=1 Tax=Streptomyces sp. NPDC047085 TaxID=3155140 RepID=UPI0033F38C91